MIVYLFIFLVFFFIHFPTLFFSIFLMVDFSHFLSVSKNFILPLIKRKTFIILGRYLFVYLAFFSIIIFFCFSFILSSFNDAFIYRLDFISSFVIQTRSFPVFFVLCYYSPLYIFLRWRFPFFILFFPDSINLLSILCPPISSSFSFHPLALYFCPTTEHQTQSTRTPSTPARNPPPVFVNSAFASLSCFRAIHPSALPRMQ